MIRTHSARPARRTPGSLLFTLVCAATVFVASAARVQSQSLIRVEVVAIEDQFLPVAGSVISSFRNPATNGLGQSGVYGSLDQGGEFIMIDDQVVFTEADDPNTVFGYRNDRSLGISDSGGFVHAPIVDGREAIWTRDGVFVVAGDPVPGVQDGVFFDLEVPSMGPDGRVNFWGSIDTTMGASADMSGLFTAPGGDLAALTAVLKSTDSVSGVALRGSFGVLKRYAFSPSGNHYIVAVNLETGDSATDTGVVVDGLLVLQEGTPTGEGDDYGATQDLLIDEQGNYIITGDTNGDSARDAFLRYNDNVEIREGDSIDGVFLGAPALPTAIAVNRSGQVAHTWQHVPSYHDTVFLACDGDDLANSSLALLTYGDMIDSDGDGVADARVLDFNSVTNDVGGLALTDDLAVLLDVELDTSNGNLDAIVRIQGSCCGNGKIEALEACDDGGESAACNADCTEARCGDGVLNQSALELCDDGGESATCNLDCSVASCGDGKTNVQAGERCDDAGESASCNADCSEASCGDGIVNVSAGEDCDFRGVENAGCNADCTFARCGDAKRNAAAGEACDSGGASASCDADCSVPVCGDGIVNLQAGEQCEDGNGQSGDGCSAGCRLELDGDAGVSFDDCPEGTEGCRCAASATCAATLSCLSGLCVDARDLPRDDQGAPDTDGGAVVVADPPAVDGGVEGAAGGSADAGDAGPVSSPALDASAEPGGDDDFEDEGADTPSEGDCDCSSAPGSGHGSPAGALGLLALLAGICLRRSARGRHGLRAGRRGARGSRCAPGA